MGDAQITDKMKEVRRIVFGSDEKFHRNIMKDLNITEEYVTSGVQVIMDWYKDQEHLPKYALDFDFIEGMFSNCKFSVEKTKQQLDDYLSVRNVMSEFFEVRHPRSKAVANGHDHTRCVLMPELTAEGYRIGFIYITDKDSRLYNPENGFKTLFMVSDLRMFYDKCTTEILIWDLSNLNFGHINKITPTIMKRAAFVFRNAYRHRVKEMHMVGMRKFAYKMAITFKGLLSKKLSERIFFHEDYESLFKSIPPKYLPSEIGGSGGSANEIHQTYCDSICSDEWINWYTRSGMELVDKTKRPTENERLNQFSEVAGTFRKLNLD